MRSPHLASFPRLVHQSKCANHDRMHITIGSLILRAYSLIRSPRSSWCWMERLKTHNFPYSKHIHNTVALKYLHSSISSAGQTYRLPTSIWSSNLPPPITVHGSLLFDTLKRGPLSHWGRQEGIALILSTLLVKLFTYIFIFLKVFGNLGMKAVRKTNVNSERNFNEQT